MIINEEIFKIWNTLLKEENYLQSRGRSKTTGRTLK